jgi:hypothetical protein
VIELKTVRLGSLGAELTTDLGDITVQHANGPCGVFVVVVVLLLFLFFFCLLGGGG